MTKDFVIENGTLLRYNGKGSNVVIPEGVTKIDYSAFSCCADITSINIPDSVKKIDVCAFYGCTGLISINIPNSVTEINNKTFYGCGGLTSINIPDSVKEIGWCAFYGTRIKRQPQGNIAYKGFNTNMTCRGFQYNEGETYFCLRAKLCEYGFHACLNPLDCFNYYCYGAGAVYHEVVLDGRTDEMESDSKVCGKKITIGRRLTLKEMSDIFNKLNEEK